MKVSGHADRRKYFRKLKPLSRLDKVHVYIYIYSGAYNDRRAAEEFNAGAINARAAPCKGIYTGAALLIAVSAVKSERYTVEQRRVCYSRFY